MDIAPNRALGLKAYFDMALHKTDIEVEEYTPTDDADDSASEAEERRSPVDRVLAVQLVDGVKKILIDWEGHFVPTWIDDDGRVEHDLDYAKLRTDLAVDTMDFQKDIGPEAYTIYCGCMMPIECCSRCSRKKQDGLDLRMFVDASTYGNVSTVCFLTSSYH